MLNEENWTIFQYGDYSFLDSLNYDEFYVVNSSCYLNCFNTLMKAITYVIRLYFLYFEVMTFDGYSLRI